MSSDGSGGEFAGKVAVVTGARSFIGTAICSQLVGAGASVVLGQAFRKIPVITPQAQQQ